jgi:hypothetical protein
MRVKIQEALGRDHILDFIVKHLVGERDVLKSKDQRRVEQQQHC